jgi:hypothetical protein
MPTLKKRINLSVDEDLLAELETLKKIRHAPSLAAVVVELAKEALEIQEDLYFSKIASERKGEKTISHSKVWK